MTLIGKALEHSKRILVPLFLSPVSAGFPSPADDYVEKRLDLNELLINHSSATFIVRAEGDSMIDAGIYSGDFLVVDRSLTPSSGHIVVSVINGEFLVKRIEKRQGKIFLVSANSRFKAIELTEDADCVVWGVVTFSIRNLNNK